MRKIITVVGARPQFVKAATLSRVFSKYSEIDEKILHTGQHFDANMSEVFFEEMNIPKPAFNLDIHSLPHGAMTGRMLEGIESVLAKENPSMVIVYGDTNSTLASALAAKKLDIPLAHVEAGLRSFNMKMPEEINRILTDRVSDLLFCPTETAIKNLNKEGFSEFDTRVFQSGDVMYDAALYYSQKKAPNESAENRGEYILATLHRAENTDDSEKLNKIVESLNRLNQKIKVVLPLHPRTKQKLKDHDLVLDVELIEPQGYLQMIQLIQNSQMVITDSGGLQKEAYYFEKGCITLRDQTEWTELIDEGVNILHNVLTDDLSNSVEESLSKEMDFSKKIYGNGNAADLIAKEIINFL